MRRMFSVPARCPISRGSPLERAQRPLPSIMMATCCGLGSSGGWVCAMLHFQDFGFLRVSGTLGLASVLVHQVVQLLRGALVLVLGDHLLVFHLLEVVQSVAPHVA